MMNMELQNEMLTMQVAELKSEIRDLNSRISALENEKEEINAEHMRMTMNLGQTLNAFFMQQVAINDLQADLADAVVNSRR